MEILAKIVGTVLLTLIALSFLSLLLAYPFMLSWNYVMPLLFGLKVLSWSQAWAVAFVANVLFKSNTTK